MLPHHDPVPRSPMAPPPALGQPGTVDARDRVHLLKIAVWFGPACFVMLSFLWYFMYFKQWIGSVVFVLLVVLNVPLTVAGVFAIDAAATGASRGLMRVLYSAGDIPPPRTYPRQEAMLARGHYREAAEYYHDHLVLEPADHEARLRLAALLETSLEEYAEAERLYKEVRAREPTPREARLAANGLIDLYRKIGRTDRLKVELARFAAAYHGTSAGEAAARELMELKRGDP